MAIQVVVVEDDHEIRNTLEHTIRGFDELYLSASFSNAEDLIRKFSNLSADVVIMDINLTGISGIKAVSQLKPLYPKVQFLMCTVYEDTDRIFDSLCAGATGYIIKSSTPDQLLNAIKEISSGGSPMSAQIARKVVNYFGRQKSRSESVTELTSRELEILTYLDKGYRYKEIADKLSVGIETVKTHIRNLYNKLQVSSRTEALNKVFGSNQ